MPAVKSVFGPEYQSRSYPHRFQGTLRVGTLMAGIPADPNKAEAYLRSRVLDADKDTELQRAVAETMIDLGITKEEAINRVNELRNLCAFKRDNDGLYIPAPHLKAALKESVSIAVAGKKIELKGWGETRKFITRYFPEHVFVVGDRLHLGVHEPHGVHQSFPKSRFGSSIQYNEYVSDVDVHFTIETDYDFDHDFWAMLLTTGERNGLGTMRSQGFGQYLVTQWDKLPVKVSKKPIVADRAKVDPSAAA